jgi:hypothetical protein
MSTSFKVALFLFAIVFLLTKSFKTALIVFIAQLILSKII